MSFEKEDRYVVIKTSDIEAAEEAGKIPTYLWDSFCDFRDAVLAHRLGTKPEREYVVIQDNWPEYGIVWKMIEERTKTK